jgi:hypothetical protein
VLKTLEGRRLAIVTNCSQRLAVPAGSRAPLVDEPDLSRLSRIANPSHDDGRGGRIPGAP